MKREAEFRIKKRFSTGCWFEETPYDYRSKVERCDGKLSAPAAIISRAPEGWLHCTMLREVYGSSFHAPASWSAGAPYRFFPW
jgi:hypothetical protein